MIQINCSATFALLDDMVPLVGTLSASQREAGNAVGNVF
jgi:hypothetical protein